MALTTTQITMKTEVNVDEANKTATFSIWLNNESEAYTLRVEALTTEERDDYSDLGYTYAVRDGYSADENMYPNFASALAAAWGFYQETQSQNIEDAGN